MFLRGSTWESDVERERIPPQDFSHACQEMLAKTISDSRYFTFLPYPYVVYLSFGETPLVEAGSKIAGAHFINRYSLRFCRSLGSGSLLLFLQGDIPASPVITF